MTRSESLWIRSTQSPQPSGHVPSSGAPRPLFCSASTVAFAAKSRSRTSTLPCWAAKWRGLRPRDPRGERHLSGQKEVENCRVFVPSFVGESWVKVQVKTTVKTLFFGTNKNEQRASTANEYFFLLLLRGHVSDELWGNFRVQHRQGCAALFLMILVVVGCHWTAFKRMAFGSLSCSCYFLPPIGQYSSPCLPMLKASFSLDRSPKTLHLVNPVDPCGFSGQVKADDLSPHLMVSG